MKEVDNFVYSEIIYICNCVYSEIIYTCNCSKIYKLLSIFSLKAQCSKDKITLDIAQITENISRLTTKLTKWPVRPAKTQISLGICPVWSESLLSTWWNIGSSATHWAHSEDSDQTGQMPRLIWVFAGRTCQFDGFVMRRLIWVCSTLQTVCALSLKCNMYSECLMGGKYHI